MLLSSGATEWHGKVCGPNLRSDSTPWGDTQSLHLPARHSSAYLKKATSIRASSS
jgi:hypothetical protein